jgi:ATP-dependent exoDNAse (exonuclease V) beta subunit
VTRDRLADQAARDRIAHDLDTTLVVEAAAGTGKTSALVNRIVETLAAGRATLDRLVAVTFTEAAAGELKLRLRAAIERARQDEARPREARTRLDGALPKLEEARIGTIHSFCSDLLREWPVEAGVDPLFQVAAEDVSEGLLGRAFERWFEQTLADPGDGVRRVLRRPVRSEEGPRAILRNAAMELVRRRDFPAPWRRDPFEREPAVDALLAEIDALGAFAAEGDPDDHFTRSLAALARFSDEQRRREDVLGVRDYDGLEAALGALGREKHWGWRGFRNSRSRFDKPALQARRDALYESLRDFGRRAGADLAPNLRDELWAVVEAYDELKRRAGCLDFLDLLLSARQLVRDDRTVRTELQARFTHLFVDEFQDTDPLQAELLLLLAAADPAETDWRRARVLPGKLFLVGDPKQSIYRFRRADVALYEDVKTQLLGAGAALVELTTSFRAVPSLQAAVNAAFAPVLQGAAGGRARYVALAPFRTDPAGQPAIVALPVPRPYGDFRTVVKWKIDESLPDAVAAWVDWLVRRSGWTVTERGDGAAEERVPVRPRHVCLLFRRFRSWGTDTTAPYVRALEARHLPHVLVGGSSFHVREEIEAIRNALAAIERPDDELAVFATLRGPFFACDDGALLAFRSDERLGGLHPFRKVPDDLPAPLAEVAEALAVLRALHRGRNRRPIADTIARLLAGTRAHAGLAIWPTGEQALANVTRLVDLARRAERGGVTSFRGFVERLADEAVRGEASEAPIVEPGTEGVRIMTVHRAKGLEFPVVILADPTTGDAPAEPARWVDAGRGLCAMKLAGAAPPELLEHADEEMTAEREETARVLYVAATRARDALVVPAIGDGPQPGWLAALHPVVYPVEGVAPDTTHPAGCPAFGPDTVFRPPNVIRPASAVAPGAHRPREGRHTVVWWDPASLTLDVQESVGLRQQTLLAADDDRRRSDAGIRAHAEWQAVRRRVRARASEPTVRVTTATERAAEDGTAPDVAVETAAAAGARPHGRRFGTLVHGLLAAVDLDGDAAHVAAAARLQGRLVGASADEVAAAATVAEAALAHPILRRAAAAARAGRCRREAPLALVVADGTLVEGVADLAFEEDGGTTDVDFKTDVEIAGRLDDYRRQVALYAEAVACATGRPARGVLLRV